MLKSLENSDRFKKEYREFSEKISNLTDENLKKDLNQKMIELLREVRYIDQQHDEIILQKSIPSSVPESRSKISEIRKYIDRKLREVNLSNTSN